MHDWIPTVKAPLASGIGALVGGALSLLGGWDMPLRALLLLNLADLVSGLAKGYVTRKLSSESCGRGVVKKLLMWLTVAVAVQVDAMIGQGNLAREGVLWFWAVVELISILENVAAAGLPIPPVLTQALAKLRAAADVRLADGPPEKPEPRP